MSRTARRGFSMPSLARPTTSTLNAEKAPAISAQPTGGIGSGWRVIWDGGQSPSRPGRWVEMGMVGEEQQRVREEWNSLREEWEQTRQQWQDEVGEYFEKEFWSDIETQVP